jgi:hypothetical protein
MRYQMINEEQSQSKMVTILVKVEKRSVNIQVTVV